MKQLAVIWKHQLGKKGSFGSAGLDVFGERTVFLFSDGGLGRLRCLDRDGATMWDHSWPDLGVATRCDRDSVYCGGGTARRIDVHSGVLAAEHRFESHADPYSIFPDGPVYETSDAVIGLRATDLGILWEMPNPEGDFGNHQGRLCRLTAERLTMLAPPSMQATTVSFETPAVVHGLHVHHDGLICQFGLTGGGRKAFDAITGKSVWAADSPQAYGLITFDESAGYTNLKSVAAYDLRTGEEKWARPLPMTTTPYVEGGKFYGGSYQQWTPQVFIIDAKTGDMLLEAEFDHRLTGLGFEPSPVRPMGTDRLIVGLRDAIACLALE